MSLDTAIRALEVLFDDLADHVKNGLEAEGAHHKQFFLEQIADVAGIDLDFDYEKGVAP